jgi:DNA mismatch repair ATPase MutS
MGKSLFRSWLLRPLMDIPTLSLRHDFVSLFSRTENRKSVEEIKSHLMRMADSQRLLSSLRRGRMRVGDWKRLLEFALKVPQIKECASELIGPYSGAMQRKVRIHSSFICCIFLALTDRTHHSRQLDNEIEAVSFAVMTHAMNDTVRSLSFLSRPSAFEYALNADRPMFRSIQIDWEESVAQNRIVCKSGIDKGLDEFKRIYDGLDHFLVSF